MNKSSISKTALNIVKNLSLMSEAYDKLSEENDQLIELARTQAGTMSDQTDEIKLLQEKLKKKKPKNKS